MMDNICSNISHNPVHYSDIQAPLNQRGSQVMLCVVCSAHYFQRPIRSCRRTSAIAFPKKGAGPHLKGPEGEEASGIPCLNTTLCGTPNICSAVLDKAEVVVHAAASRLSMFCMVKCSPSDSQLTGPGEVPHGLLRAPGCALTDRHIFAVR
jgi:hypothetical protein